MIRKSLKIIIFNLTLAGALFSQAEVISITSPTSGAIIDTNFVRVSFEFYNRVNKFILMEKN